MAYLDHNSTGIIVIIIIIIIIIITIIIITIVIIIITIIIIIAGLSLRFQVAGCLLLVAGEVASSHEAPTPKKFLKYNFYRFPKGITAPKKAIFVKSRAIISGFMMVTSLLKKTTF